MFMKKLKSYTYSILNTLVKISLELFIFDRKIRRILKGNFCKWYLKPYILAIESENIKLSETPKEYRIWQYWNGDIQNAPDIVKCCIKSVKKYKGNLEHVILSDETIKNYITIPDYIYELKNRGIIKAAHFADIVRTYLLYEYGGLWIDATVLLTAPLPEYIRDSELFVFKHNINDDPDGLNMANYFISSKGNSVIIAKMKRFLEEYWKNNYFVINYFFYLHAFTIFTQSSKDNIKEWSEIFYSPFIPVQLMQNELTDKFSPKRYEELKQISPIHKLTYKKNVMSKKKKFDPQGTLYEYLITH